MNAGLALGGSALAVAAAGALYGVHTFSAHMGAHLLLAFGAAPLAVLGLPRWRPRTPFLAAALGLNLLTYGVHLPAAYHRIMLEPPARFLEGAAFLLAGVGFWLAVARGGVGALTISVVQMVACALLGAAITFSRPEIYMSAGDDVALGGVLMWVVGGLAPMLTALTQAVRLLKGATI